MTRPALFLAPLALLVAASLAQAEDPTSWAQQLVSLRTEVEDLSETLEVEREALRTDLRANELRRTELETRIRQEELRVAELERELARQRSVIEADSTAYDALAPTVMAGIDTLVAQIQRGLPFRQSERIDALTQLRTQVEGKLIDPRTAVGRVWQAVEDELRLGRENILDRQVITVDGAEVYVQVARLGMVAMFFRAEDGRVGAARRSGEAWSFTWLPSPEDKERVDALFGAMDKQQRVGWFELPWALPEVSP